MNDESKPVCARIVNFDEESLFNLKDRLYEAFERGQPAIIVEISSYGGSVPDLFGMIDLIEDAKTRISVITYASGKAMSAGAVLLSCGTPGHRFAGTNATVMIHSVSSMHRGNAAEIEYSTKELKRQNRRLFDILAKNTGTPRGHFEGLLKERHNTDLYLCAKQAKANGIVDRIGVPTLGAQLHYGLL